MLDLAIVIVSWKVKDKLAANLRELLASQGDFSFEVWVVDNNSGDGTVEMIKHDFPQVHLIANPDNRGLLERIIRP